MTLERPSTASRDFDYETHRFAFDQFANERVDEFAEQSRGWADKCIDR